MKRLVLAVVLLAGIVAASAEPALVPRDDLFGNPERTEPRLSPDGKTVAWLQPDRGVLQIWVRPVAGADATPVTAERTRPVRTFRWAEDGSLLYEQDANGDENFHVFRVDLESRSVKDLTPFAGVRASIVRTSPKRPGQVLVQTNQKDRARFDLYRLELATGALGPDTTNPGDVIAWAANDDLVVRAALATLPGGGQELRVRDGARSRWRTLTRVGPDDTLELHDLTADGRAVLYTTSAGGDTARVVQRSTTGGPEKTIAQSKEVDPSEVWIHPDRHVVQGVVFEPGKPEWSLLDPTVKKDFDVLRELSPGFPEVVSRDRADRTWLVAYRDARGPTRFYSFDRTSLKGTFLFADRPKLASAPLADVVPVAFPARDALPLRGYLTRPRGASAATPLVLFVHGGPWSRDRWEFDPVVQWLANRGYAVLQVNFRGSTGYGRAFLNAGNRQWGRAMHTDLLDAVDWAVRTVVALPDRIAVFGASYGGYAVLAAAAFTPHVFRCGVDLVGPSNLTTLLKAVPPYWRPMKAMFARRVGDVDAPADRALLDRASPLFSADAIEMPLLIGQGANDPRVNRAESERIVAALEKRGVGVTYVLYPDEGHGFARPENTLDFTARSEVFLSGCLGGRAEPLAQDPLPGSTAVVRVVKPSAPAATPATPGTATPPGPTTAPAPAR